MGKKILFGILLFLSPFLQAKEFNINKTIPCDTLKNVLSLIVKYEESVFWQASNPEKLITVLTLNLDTKTWTIILTDGDLACVMDTGKGFEFIDTLKQRQKGNVKNITRS